MLNVPKKIFVIPSWYPNGSDPNSGIFIKEQVLALGTLRQELKIAVSLWGQGERTITRRTSSISQVFSQGLPKKSKTKVDTNIIEFKRPTLSWGEQFFGGNIGSILNANAENFEDAIQEFGGIDLIHAHVSYPAGWVAMKLSEKMGVPYIITEHMSPFPFPRYLNKNGTLKEIVFEPLEKSRVVIAVSPSSARELEKYNIKKIQVIPNLVDEIFFDLRSEDVKEKKGEGKFVFFTLGYMVQQKGIIDLLQAARRFLDGLSGSEKETVCFNIGGDGPELNLYKNLSRSLELEPWINWLGFLSKEEVKNQFQNCNCFVLPSHHESFGIVYAEANACGKPVIATRSGGPEYIVTPENGLLVDVGNIQQLADVLLQMFREVKKYDPFLIRKQFLERFSRKVIVDKIEHIYRNVQLSN